MRHLCQDIVVQSQMASKTLFPRCQEGYHLPWIATRKHHAAANFDRPSPTKYALCRHLAAAAALVRAQCMPKVANGGSRYGRARVGLQSSATCLSVLQTHKLLRDGIASQITLRS